MSESVHEKAKYPFMEYLFTGEGEPWLEPLVGSAIRAIGKGWPVAVLARGENLVFWQEFQKFWQSGVIRVGESLSSFDDIQLLILDSSLSEKEQNSWREHSQVVGKMHLMAAGPSTAQGYNLVSNFQVQHLRPGGVHAFTGTGKGKTTSALGWAWMRAQGKPVAVVQWFKEKSSGHLTWAINEHFASDHLLQTELLKFYPTGLGFFGSPALDRVKGEQAYQHHRNQALEGLALASRVLHEGKIGALVLDELVDTVASISENLPQDLLHLSEVQAILRDATTSGIPVAVSGRRVTPDWERFIGTSVVIANERHPWTHEKRAAVSGLDF